MRAAAIVMACLTVPLCLIGAWLFAILAEQWVAGYGGLHPLFCAVGVAAMFLIAGTAVRGVWGAK